MVPHLETAVDTQVELRVLIYSTGIAGLKTGEGHRKRLFIELGGLRLPRILNAVHARRKHIVDGGAPRILFYVHNRHVKFALGRRVVAVVEVELIATPFTAYKLECGETQMCGLLESGHKHTCETYRREVIDSAYDLIGRRKRYLELIPYDGLRTVNRSHTAFLPV